MLNGCDKINKNKWQNADNPPMTQTKSIVKCLSDDLQKLKEEVASLNERVFELSEKVENQASDWGGMFDEDDS